MKKILLGLFLITLFFPVSAKAGTDADEAEALVKKAVAHYLEVGEEQAVKDFHSDAFKVAEIYVFMCDFEGNVHAQGSKPALVGQNLSGIKDTDGVPFFQEFAKKAQTAEGKGWVDYKWQNPETKKIQQKTSYIEKIPGKDMYIGAGIYK